MTIPELRIKAALALGIAKEVNGKAYVNGMLFDGSTSAYRELPAGDQISLTDRMAGMIKSDPSSYTPAQVAVADTRVNSASYNRPLAATSYINVTGELLKTGELQDALVGGAKSYFENVNKYIAIGAVGLALYALIQASK